MFDPQVFGIFMGFVALIIGLVVFFVFARFFRLWIQSVMTGAGIRMFDLLGMTFRKVNPAIITRTKIMAVQAGLDESTGITSKALEAHYLAGGNVPQIIRAMIAAMKAKTIKLTYQEATAIDLAGRDVLEAVQISVYPKVIDCPAKASDRSTLDAVAKNGIQLKVRARVTVRANLQRLIGGATEETIVARVGEGIVSAIGSAESHETVLQNPDVISKTVLARRLDAQTAFEIVSIDIADIDVGENIGARLQADRAEPICAWPAPARKAVARWPPPRSKRRWQWLKKAALNWSRRRPKYPKPWPIRFAVGGWGFWIITSFATCRRIRTCAPRLPAMEPADDPKRIECITRRRLWRYSAVSDYRPHHRLFNYR